MVRPDSNLLLFLEGHFLPPFKQCPMAFMLEVVAGKKQLLLEANIKKCTPPHWPELCLRNMWPKVSGDPNVAIFFPTYKDGELPPRSYFWGVFATAKPDYYKAVIDHALAQRSNIDTSSKEAAIVIKNEWLAKLLAAKIVPSKSDLILLPTLEQKETSVATDSFRHFRQSKRSANRREPTRFTRSKTKPCVMALYLR